MRLILVGLEMSKVLHLLDWNDLLSYRHEKWIVAEMKEQERLGFKWKPQEKLEDENITDDDKFESYVNPDGDTHVDDVPF